MSTVVKNHTRVRRFTEADIPLIVKTCMIEIPKLPHYRNLTVEPDRIRFLLTNALADENTIMCHLLINDDNIAVGGVAGYCVTSLMSWDKVCNDLFLFVFPEWRSLQNAIKLINSYKEWAKRRGAKIIGATHTGGLRSDAMDMLLIKNGFERVGAIYYVTHTG